MRGQCWFEGQNHGCSNCGGLLPSNKCRQPDKVISMPNPVANPQQQAQENMRGARAHGAVTNDLWCSNLYFDHGKTNVDLQTTNGYIPMQNKQVAQPTQDPRRPPPPTDPGACNSQDVRVHG